MREGMTWRRDLLRRAIALLEGAAGDRIWVGEHAVVARGLRELVAELEQGDTRWTR